MRMLLWSVKRELWENRSIYVAPLIAGAVFVFAFLVSLMTMPGRLRSAVAMEAAKRQLSIQEPYDLAAVIIMATGIVVGIVYALEAPYAERKDRSILFWKSLPVSDRTSVLAKALVPIVIVPLLSAVVTVAVHLLMLFLSSLAALMVGVDVTVLWHDVAPFRRALEILYHMVAIHSLWYAPIFGWLLLAAAWARRAPLLWAAIPLLAIEVVERLAFGTSHWRDLLQYRVVGGPAALAGSGAGPIDSLVHITPVTFLASPGLWLGLLLTALFLAAATRIRRYRGPI